MTENRVTPGATHCRFCATPLELTVVDLGKSPLCESFLTAEQLESMEPFYPLHVRICTACWLAQLPSFVPTRGDLRRVRVLLGLFGLVGRARPAVRHVDLVALLA